MMGTAELFLLALAILLFSFIAVLGGLVAWVVVGELLTMLRTKTPLQNGEDE